MDDNLYFLAEIFNNADMFLLIMVRLLGFFVIMPIFSGSSVPGMARMGFAAAFSIIIYTTGAYGNHAIFFHENIIGFALIAITEFLIGFVQAYIVYIMFSMLYFVGQLLDRDIGFAMVSVLDPISQLQVPIIGNILFMLAMVIMIISDGLNFFLGALFQSYHIIPVGAVWFFEPYQAVSWHIIRVIIGSFELGLRISMPIMGSILVVNLALGMLLKSMPQMNMFVVGMPLKLVFGLGMLIVLLPIFANVSITIFDRAFYHIEYVIFLFGTTAGQ